MKLNDISTQDRHDLMQEALSDLPEEQSEYVLRSANRMFNVVKKRRSSRFTIDSALEVLYALGNFVKSNNITSFEKEETCHKTR